MLSFTQAAFRCFFGFCSGSALQLAKAGICYTAEVDGPSADVIADRTSLRISAQNDAPLCQLRRSYPPSSGFFARSLSLFPPYDT